MKRFAVSAAITGASIAAVFAGLVAYGAVRTYDNLFDSTASE